MRRPIVRLMLVLATGCAPVVHQETHVAVRPKASPADQAVAIFHGSQVCSFTIRDLNGQLHDEEQRRGGTLPVDMSRAVPDRPWWVDDSAWGARLVTVIAMPPGRYELVAYTEAKSWQEGRDENGRALGQTNCPRRWHLLRHDTRLPFDVSAGRVALLAVPGGKPEDPALRQTRWMLDHVYDPEVRALVHSWKPAILRAEDEAHAAFLASIRQPRAGYDVYPLCNGPKMAGVVRAAGTPFPWYGHYKKDVIEDFRRRVPVPPAQGTGFGGGCVETRGAFHVYLKRDDQLEPAIRAAGEWLAREDLQGEIDITVTGPFVDLAGSPAGSTEESQRR